MTHGDRAPSARFSLNPRSNSKACGGTCCITRVAQVGSGIASTAVGNIVCVEIRVGGTHQLISHHVQLAAVDGICRISSYTASGHVFNLTLIPLATHRYLIPWGHGATGNKTAIFDTINSRFSFFRGASGGIAARTHGNGTIFISC